jgi:hypothetical protein
MFKNNFIVAIKNKGNILRERDGVVSLPFSSDYSILLKNEDSKKAIVKVSIDGQDVLDGNSLIVVPGSPLDLKGFMKGSTVKNRFRFIEKTKQISNYRGDRIEDGIVRVEFRYEKAIPDITWTPAIYPTWPNNYPVVYNDCPYDNQASFTYSSCVNSSTLKSSNNIFSAQNVDGITVKGAETRQDFTVGSVNTLEKNSYVMTLYLTGRTYHDMIVKKPLITKDKLKCSTCGVRSKSHAKFCSNCGTFLE